MSVDFSAWLSNPDNENRRNLLADAKAYSGGSEVTRKLSYLYSPAAGAYLPGLGGFPVFEQRIREPFGGRSEQSVGVLEIPNRDGLFDDWLFDSWGGRSLELRFGDVDWARADYEVIRTATIKYLEAPDPQRLRLVYSDPLAKLDKMIQLNTVDDGSNGEIEIPLCYGYCQQVTPKVVDPGAFEYQVHDGAVEDCSVGQLWINGDENVLSYTENNSTGVIDVSSNPGGVLTLITKGAKPSGTWLTKPGEIIREIITAKGGLTDPDDLDTAAFMAFDSGAPTIGLYIAEPRNILDVLDEIVASVGGWYGINRAGKFTLGYIQAPTAGASVKTLKASLHQIRSRISVTPMVDIAPRYKTRIGYARAWTINQSENPNINPDDREHFARGYRVAEFEDASAATIQTEHLDAEAPEVEQTLLAYEADALDEAERRQGIFRQRRYFCEFWAGCEPFELGLGDVITVYDDTDVTGRYGFDTGRPIVITGLEEHLAAGKVKVEGWF